MKKTLAFTTILVLASLLCYGQSGLHVYTGISNAKNKDSRITPEGHAHKGYHLGADARLNSGNMYFVIGGQFHNINYLAQNSGSFFSIDEKMRWLKLRVGLGYNIINFTDKIALRAKTLGSITFISKYPELQEAPFQNYNSGTAGAVVGLGMDIYAFTFDIEYEKGFFNAVNMVKGTEFDFFTVNVGVRF